MKNKAFKRGAGNNSARSRPRTVSLLVLLIATACLYLMVLKGRIASRSARVLATVEEEFKGAVHDLGDELHAFKQQAGNLLHYRHRLRADRILDALKVPDATCKAHFGVEYAGRRLDVQPGNKDSAAACCAACQENEECDTWSWCGHPDKCLDLLHNCILRNGDNPTLPTKAQAGPTVGWTSGFHIRDTQLDEMFTRRDIQLVNTNKMLLGLRKGPATISHLGPKGEPSFSFAAPHDLRVMNRSAGGFHHLGDVTLRVRFVSQDPGVAAGDTGWFTTYSTVPRPGGPAVPPTADAWPINVPPPSSLHKPVQVHGHVDLRPQLPPDAPVRITRWIEVPKEPGFGLHAFHAADVMPEEIRMYWNITYQPPAGKEGLNLELGSLALSMPFDQVFAERTLETVAVQCSFVEAYPGGPLGHIQVVRATGSGPSLLVLPAPDTATSFEAWRHLNGDDASLVGFGFEGHYEVMTFSKAWAVNEWRAAKPWVTPTSQTLAPGQSIVVGVRMVMASGPQQVEDALLAMGHPVVVGAPGFIVHADMADARMFVKHTPSHLSLDSIEVEPAGAIELNPVSIWGHSGPRPPPPGVHIRPYKLSFPRQPGSGANVDDNPTAWVNCPAYDAVNSAAPGTNAATLAKDCPTYVGRVTLKLKFRRNAPPGHLGHLGQAIQRAPGGRGGSAEVLEQYVQVLVLPPASALVKQYGRTSADPAHGWLPEDANDPWGRSPAFMGYDNEAKKALLHELRVYMSGLSDESGAAQPLAMAVKQLGSPSADQIHKLEEYVAKTLYAPSKEDRRKYIQDHDTYAVRASLMYNGTDPAFKQAQPEFIDKCFKTGPYWQICWDEKRSLEFWRAYNYPHVAAVYWSLYRLARVGSPALTTKNTWEFYLRQAVRTFQAMWEHGKGYGRWGLMVGSVFTHIARDVQLEGWTKEQQALEALMKERLAFWQGLTFPFGSEMSWDNTGHEEIASWLAVANDTAGEAATVQAVEAYTRLVPHWAISGSARRWWDFFINGKAFIGNERVYHHYAGALNAVPVLQFYKKHPHNLQLLRLATAGTMGSLSNIKPDGGASMGWHGDPRRLNMDGYSADYGIGFFGYAMQAGGALACDDELGWLCFNCDITRLQSSYNQHAHTTGDSVCHQQVETSITPRDAFKRRLFLAPLAIDIAVEKAWITQLTADFAARTLQLTLSAHDLADGSGNGAATADVSAVLTVKTTALQGTVSRVGALVVKCNGSPCERGSVNRGPGSVLVQVKQQQAASPQVVVQWEELRQ